MHHYCTVTADTLSLRQDMAYVWRVAVPREGYKHSFVVHGILAIAAAHKAYLVPSFRHELQKITQDNWTALFSFASVLVLYSFSLPVRSTEGKLSNPIDNLLELVSLVRGIKTTMAPLVPRLYHSEFAPMGYGIWPAESDGSPNGYPTLDNTFLPSDLWDVARQLRAFQETEVPLDSLVHYRKAVNDLEYSARLVASAGAHAESGAVIAWLYSLDEEILVDIGARKLCALLLLAHFCVFLAGIKKNFWYARGWAEPIFGEVECALKGHTRFASLLQWPRRHLDTL
ncbi:hypothetical protein ACJ41O_012306 [Fusarium nematophilum]